MTNDLNLNNNKLINVKQASNNSDGVNLDQLNKGILTLVLQNSKLLSNYIKRNGSTTMTNNFDTVLRVRMF